MNSFFNYLSYLRRAKHHGGHGVHSPFAFDLILNILEEKNPYYHYTALENQRKILAQKNIPLQKRKYDQAAFRLVNAARPASIIEIGSSAGITSAYLTAANKKTPYFLLQNSDKQIPFLPEKINIINGNFEDTLPQVLSSIAEVGSVYFHTEQSGEKTTALFEQCLSKASNECVFIFEGIHASKETEAIWKKVIQKEQVRVSLDMYRLGLVYINPSLQKQDYIYLF
jgi:hypothetical protein